MSTATYERPPLYAVPTPEEQQVGGLVEQAVLPDAVEQGPQLAQQHPSGRSAGQGQEGVEGLPSAAPDGEQEAELGLLLFWGGDRIQRRPLLRGCAHDVVLLLGGGWCR